MNVRIFTISLSTPDWMINIRWKQVFCVQRYRFQVRFPVIHHPVKIKVVKTNHSSRGDIVQFWDCCIFRSSCSIWKKMKHNRVRHHLSPSSTPNSLLSISSLFFMLFPNCTAEGLNILKLAPFIPHLDSRCAQKAVGRIRENMINNSEELLSWFKKIHTNYSQQSRVFSVWVFSLHLWET